MNKQDISFDELLELSEFANMVILCEEINLNQNGVNNEESTTNPNSNSDPNAI